MKIRINENEAYNIDLPNEIDLEQLTGILSRLNSISKLVSKETFNEIPKIINPNKEQWTLLKNDRNVFIEVMKAYYTEGLEEWNRVAEKYGLTMLKDNKKPMNAYGGKKLMEFHKITPQEIGLLKLPTRGERIGDLKIKEIENISMKEAIAKNLERQRAEKKDWSFMRDKSNTIEVFKLYNSKPFEDVVALMKNKFGINEFNKQDLKNCRRFLLLHNIKDEEIK